LSDSPPEKDISWSETGMSSSYKFIQKFSFMSEKICKMIENKVQNENKELEIFTNQMINKVNIALEKFRYNVIIAVFHEIYNFYIKIAEEDKNYRNLKESFEKILIIMMPVIPHLANEYHHQLTNNTNQINWPSVNEELLISNEKEIVIQVNGKKRGNILININDTEDDIVKNIKDMKLIDKYLENKKISKTIYVKQRLINFIIN